MQQELDLLGFQEQLTKEELEALESDALKEVTTHSSFYFKVDANKVDKNLKIYNIKAPGNKYRHPSVALPHENVHIQHYIDTSTLDDDKLFEIYAYYSYLVDLHIGQIRPQNLDDLSYVPPHFN